MGTHFSALSRAHAACPRRPLADGLRLVPRVGAASPVPALPPRAL